MHHRHTDCHNQFALSSSIHSFLPPGSNAKHSFYFIYKILNMIACFLLAAELEPLSTKVVDLVAIRTKDHKDTVVSDKLFLSSR